MHVGVTPTQHGTTQTHQKRLPKPPSWPSSQWAIGRLWNPPTSHIDSSCCLVYNISPSRRDGQRLQIAFGRHGVALTKLDSQRHQCVMGVLSPCVRVSPACFSDRKHTQKLPFHTLISQPLQWSDINIVFQFCLLHEVVSHRWKTLRFKLSHSLNLSAWRLPSMQFWNKEASFWFLHSVTFFDWVRLVGMEINTALCIWCSLISSPHCLQVEAREAGLCVFVCVCLYMRSYTLSQRLEHNNSSSSWRTGKLLSWARPKKERKTVWNDSKETKREKGKRKNRRRVTMKYFVLDYSAARRLFQMSTNVSDVLSTSGLMFSPVIISVFQTLNQSVQQGCFFLLISPCWWCSRIALGPLLELNNVAMFTHPTAFYGIWTEWGRACRTIFHLVWFDFEATQLL